MDNDIEILNANNELLQLEVPNGFRIEKSKFTMNIKKIASNIYKLIVLAVAAISEIVPEFLEKVPGLRYAIDFIVGYGKNIVSQIASDEFFDKVVCPMAGLEVSFTSPEYCKAFVEFTHHEGKYFQISMIIKSIATFAIEHPGLVLAGGMALVGLIYKLISTILKKYANRMRYHEMNDNQKEIYLLIKDILKKTKKIKKTNNGDILVNDLNITYKIIDNLNNHPEMLDVIHGILLNIKKSITNNEYDSLEEYRIDLENAVAMFENNNDHILYNKMRLVADKKLVKTKI